MTTQEKTDATMNPRWLQVIGLALNVIGTAIIFLFAYPPADEARRALYVRLSRLAVLLVFCGFFLQLIWAFYGER
jgi:hypothetical protein